MSHQSLKLIVSVFYVMYNINKHDFVPEDRFTGQLPESGWSNGASSVIEGEHKRHTT
jgi:hypothetical protein